MVYSISRHFWVCFANRHLRGFASMFISEVKLKFSFLMLLFSGFWNYKYQPHEMSCDIYIFFLSFFRRVCKKGNYPLPESVKKITCKPVWAWGFLCRKILNFFNGYNTILEGCQELCLRRQIFFINLICWRYIPA